MSARVTPDPSQPSTTLSLIRLSGKRVLRLIQRPRKRVSLLLVSLLAAWIPHFAAALDLNALPTQGSVKVGSGQINQTGNSMVVNQGSARLGVDWQSFNIGANGSVTFLQPGKDAVALNRVVGNDASQIFGRLTANGQVFLVNPNGVLFAPGSKVDVGGLVASSLDLSQDDFKNGKYQFVGIDGSGRVINQGDIKAATGGYVALFAPQVKNEGSINVPVGQVVLAGGRAVTVDITGSGLISAVITQGAKDSSVENSGTLSAPGGSVRMTAKAAQDTVGGLVNNTGIVKASTLVNKNGEIWLLGDSVSNTGEVRAEGNSTQVGGLIQVEAVSVALGGTLSVDGGTGGQIVVEAGQRLSLAENVSARGLNGQGGRVAYTSGGGVLETSTSFTDANGATDGGEISVEAASGVSSSGHYYAAGATGKGGHIDVSGHSVYLLSAELDASGALGGGRIRVGGDFQGGKTPASPVSLDEVNRLFVRRWEDSVALASADSTFINDATSLNVSSNKGAGGTAIVWSNSQTTFLGRIDAQGASSGGAVEISSGETLKQAALDRVLIGSGGQLLLDPKNLVIGNPDAMKQWQYQAVLESVYAWKASVPVLGTSDYLGYSVALSADAKLMAVGALGDDGAAGSNTDAGAVHLFAFQDGAFNGGALVGTIGVGYLGGKNINVALDNSDYFGSGVALSSNGQLLAVGACYDDGFNNALTNSGAVHLFTFGDTAFGSGVKVGTMGSGYTGSGNINVSLQGSDYFGWAVALSGDGSHLAVGAPLDDGVANTKPDSGAVHLFSFGSGFSNGVKVGTVGNDYAGAGNLAIGQGNYDYFGSSVAISRDGTAMAVGARYGDAFGTTTGDYGNVHLFTLNGAFAPTKVGTIGLGYVGANDINLPLDASDNFGLSIALNGDGTRLAVGAPFDNGFGNATVDTGAVYLFTFGATGFHSGSLASILGSGYGAGNGATNGVTNGVDVPLNNYDYFGIGVALSSDAMHMAAGAYADDGAKNNLGDSGAVHLFSFSDTSFAGGALVGSVGQDYRNDRGTGVSLDGSPRSAGNDWAGSAVALNSNARLLAVGAPGDDGYGDMASDTGAVHLITFADGDFGGAALVGTLGKGYVGGNNVDVNLRNGDQFGFGVALSGDGTKLAAGAWQDTGAGNNISYAGAVHLFTFADTSFGGGHKVGTIGSGYTGTNDINLALDASDRFGVSVALNSDGTRMAAGAYLDDGYANSMGDSGAVHLFTFGPGFTGGSKVASIGNGYTTAQGASNIPVSLGGSDYFGVSVALSADGKKLAVGAYGDDGATNAIGDTGAVYLFSFTDASGPFSGGSKVGTIGSGYTTALAPGNVDIVLGSSDYFGRGVALNASGTLLAAGAPYDDGATNGRGNSGAVHLFTFGDANFGGGALAGSIGDGYSGGRNVDIRLDGSDYFGNAVTLNANGDRLVVGAPYDDGVNNAATDSGAVHLFSFTDTAFNGGRLVGHIGNGYRSESNLSLDLYGSKSWNGDQAGYGVSLSADARQLVIGAPFDDGGQSNPWDNGNYGAVHLLTFTDGNFGGASLVGTIGSGYSGGKNVDVALDANDNFGVSVALSGDGRHLAVGATGDAGNNNVSGSTGAVRLFTFDDSGFSNGQLKATLGVGYNGANDVIPTTSPYYNYYFGRSVALNADGTRLAVGSDADGSGIGYNYSSGAVRLFTFNPDFTGGQQIATIGSGYTTAQDPDNVTVTLPSYAYFGSSVALNAAGNLLAVGAVGDAGFGAVAGNSGAVRLFTFGANFTGGAQVATIGMGYSGAQDINIPLSANSNFGRSVALSGSGTQLAVGVPQDDGANNDRSQSGSVRLFTFADTAFGGGTQVGTIGSGYSGGKNVESGAANNDQFGWSVALNGAGDRMAVGVPLDDGADNTRTDSGTVQLFSFTDSAFSGGRSVGRIGNGYLAQTSLPLNLQGNRSWSGDQAGSAVALSADATQMAIGSPYDDAGNQQPTAGGDYGSVSLVTFTNGNFGGAALAATLGRGYTGGKNLDVALDVSDHFGSSVALSGDGRHLAVGTPQDDGFNNANGNSGAVHLFTFTDNTFGGAQKQGTVGMGYTGANNVNIPITYADSFGWSVALNGDGTRLAVGDRYNLGFNSSKTYSGAVHLFTFSNASFGGGQKVGTIGSGYVGAGDVNVVLDASDYFGWSVALSSDATALAVGAVQDHGFNNLGLANSGAVHLFTFGNTSFGTGQKTGTIGSGYTGTGDVNVTLRNGDNFGYGVALSADASKLVVGAPNDLGSTGTYYYSGAVRTFSFGAGFGSGTRVGTLGSGYSATNDLNLAASNANYSYFGRAVALSGDGTRLAVGVPLDDGFSTNLTDAGAVQLFTFGAGLTAPAKVGTIGNGYIGVASLDAPFTGAGNSNTSNSTFGGMNGDQFGTAVALSADARQLAVGAPGDVGGNLQKPVAGLGAVHLVTFADGNFGGAALAGTIGQGYSGGKNVNVNLRTGDQFGSGVALSGDGTHLAVGALGDDGANQLTIDAGAVHLFTFADTAFGGGQKVGTMGMGYAGPNDVAINLVTSSYFGSAVALNTDGTRLAVGAPRYANYGAVHLFTFGSGLTGGTQIGSIGLSTLYTKVADPDNVPIALDSNDAFGSSVALSGDGRLLAVGAMGDYGATNVLGLAGAVHLFTFGDGFVSGTKVGSIGSGYSGAGNLGIALNGNDYFGSGVALSADGTRLAVGAFRADGSGQAVADSGSVQLFTFSDTLFGGAQKVATVGSGYYAAKDVSLGLEGSDNFGRSVALSGDGQRMVVGAPGDDGANNNAGGAGAAHLFTFTNGSFGGGQHLGAIGQAYVPVSQALDLGFVGTGNGTGDAFGYSVALSANARQLAVGSPNNVGVTRGNLQTSQGAVSLITFADGNFGGAQLAGTIGSGYSGGKNINLSLGTNDYFGSSVALSRDGLSLAVGAPGDDGADKSRTDSGAVHLFTFADTAFAGGQKVATLGYGYSGGNNLSVALDTADYFGQGVALNQDGTRLAVGAPYDDGTNNAVGNAGAVHLFTFAPGFTAGSKTGTVGTGYLGAGDVNLAAGSNRNFGWSVALSGDGKLMAAGAPQDYGLANNMTYAGAVYLLSFADAFASGAKVATLGLGYSGVNDININLHNSDFFGRSVALSTDGSRLAVGIPGDDGAFVTRSNYGAISLFSFAGSGFTGGSKTGTIGADYSGIKDVNFVGNGNYDTELGYSVALSGDASRLAAGFINNAGQINSRPQAGAVKLFSFSDGDFSNGQLVGNLGYAYQTAASSLSLPWAGATSYSGDYFGSAVAMDASGNLLAVGAPGDDGFRNANRASGAVYLFQFGGVGNTQASLLGTMGSGYTGGKNVSVALDAGDAFGSAVALNSTGTVLAVGAPLDDGNANLLTDSGAVHLFSFTDSAFSGGSQTGRLGTGYSGIGSLGVNTLDYGDHFGASVALSADAGLLAVGAPLDKGAANSYVSATDGYGAVHLFKAVGGTWSQTGTLGFGYSGTGNVNLTSSLDTYDQFGSSLAMNADGSLLAVGARFGSGFNNQMYQSGEVHLFTMGSSFAAPAKVGMMGYGYVANLSDADLTNDRNLNLSVLTNYDYFGSALALTADGLRLAVGSPLDDGPTNTNYDSGAVYLFAFGGTGFASPAPLSTVGAGYSAVGDLQLKLENSDNFGSAVAFNADGSRLAVGIPIDNGMAENKTNAGAVRVLAFGDRSYAQGFEIAALGDGRLPGHVSFPTVTTNDQFGAALALSSDGTRLAVGAPGDDGLANDRADAGAVHLFSFTDGNFSGASLEGTVGFGYTGGKNVNVDLGWGDAFGSAVALNATATQLAVGAPKDDGFGNDRQDAGAVHLFTFADSNFVGGHKTGTVGYGYTGTGDVNIASLDAQDYFGKAVALSANGQRLAVGAPYDDGATNALGDAGAVYLYSFTDAAFSGGALAGRIGSGYSGAGNLNLALEYSDYFGLAVALNGSASLLAVGTPGDDGFNNVSNYCCGYSSGAVHLFGFADSSFGTPTKLGSVGLGYAGAGDIAVPLEYNDHFGTSVALSSDATVLAAGAILDSGPTNNVSQAGAVYMFGFADTAFGGGKSGNILGSGYTSVGQVPVNLAANDFFGSALALNGAGDHLAVGAPGRDSTGGSTLTDTGTVYLFQSTTLSPNTDLTTLTFGANQSATAAVSVSDLAAALASGTNVSLQANNDLMLAAALNVSGTTGGNLSLRAGRRVLLNGDITTANGNLTIKANAPLADGVVNTERDVGPSVLTMDTGRSIDAGTGSVNLTLASGTGLTNSTSGNITLGTVKGSTITVENLGPTAGSGIVLNGKLSSTGDIVVATTAGNLTNNFGATALASSAGRWLVYATDWNSYENGLVGAAGGNTPRLYNQTYALNPPSGVAAGNHVLYRSQPTAYVYANSASKIYGDADPTLTYYSSGLINDDGVADTFLSAGFSQPTLSVSAVADPLHRAVGSYAITVAYTQTGSNVGYVVNAGNSGATLRVDAKQLSLNGLSVNSKTYDGSASATIASLGSITGLLSGDTVVVNNTAEIATFADIHVGLAKRVNVTGLTLSGANAGNYSVTNLYGFADINRKTVSLTSFTAQDKTYDGNIVATVSGYGTLTGLVGNETLVLGGGSARFADKNAGSGKTVTLSSAILSNGTGIANDYVLGGTLPSTTASILKKSVGASGSRAYDSTTNALASNLTLGGIIGADSVSLQGIGSVATKSVGTAKPVTLGTLAVSGADAGNYVLNSATLNITALQLGVTGISVQNRVYDGTTNAYYTGTPTLGGSLLSGDAATLNVGNLSVSFVDKNAGSNKPLVATGLSLTGADAANYQIVVADTASIAPRALSVNATAQNKLYDGTRTASLAYTDNRLTGDVLSVNGSASFDTKNAGVGKLVSANLNLTGTDAQNYFLPNAVATANGNISVRPLSISATAQNKVYDRSTSASVTFTDNRIAGDAISLSALADFANMHVGTGKAVTGSLSVSGVDAGNYSFTTALNLSANITARPLQASGTRVYDGTALVAAADFALTNTMAGDTIGLSGSGNMLDKNVGLHKAVSGGTLALSGTNVGDYSLISSAIDITPRLLTVSGITALDKIYDGNKTATASGTAVLSGGVLPNDAVSIIPTPNITVEFSDKNAGQNKQLLVAGGLITGADAPNYLVQVQGTANITQRELTLGATAQDKVYDGTRTAQLQVSDNRVAGDALAIVGTGLFGDKNVGTAKPVAVDLTVSGLDALNYFYTPVTSSSANITPRALNLGATAANRVYDGTTQAALTLSDNRVSGDAISVAASGSFADKNVGTAKPVQVAFTLGGADLGNYSYTNSLSTSANITVRALNFSNLTVADKVYDGTVAANFSGTFSLAAGLIAGDAVNADVSNAIATFANKNAGVNKAVTVSGVLLTGAASGNYSVVSSVGTATIFKKTVDVRGLTPDSKVYDGNTSATVSGIPDITASFISGDVVSLNSGNFAVQFADKNVGTNKALHVTGNLLTGADAINYDPLLNTTASITARSLVVTATAANKTYDGNTNASVTLSDNRVLGDVLSFTDSAAFADKNAGANKAVNITNLALAGTDALNYSLAATTLHSTANIAPKTLSVTGKRVYDGSTALQPSSLTFNGVVSGDAVTLDSAVALATKNVGTNKALSGALLLSGSDAPNYVLNNLSFEVTPKTLTVSGLAAANKVYDGTTSATATGTPTIGLELITGDQVTADLSAVQFAFLDKNAGLAKTVRVTGNVLSGSDAANYQTVLSATADITPKLLTVTGVGAQDKVYDGTTTATRLLSGTPALSGSIISGDDFTVNLSNVNVAFADKNAGTAKALVVSGASMGGADAGNYRVTIPNATANISQRDLHFTAQDKVYDGTVTATVQDDHISGDTLSVSATGVFVDKNAGIGKSVTLSGLSVSGADAPNYAYATSNISTTATITAKAIDAVGTKVYDGSTAIPTASLGFSGVVTGDVLGLNGTVAMVDKNVGTNKPINGALLLSGADAQNYSLSSLQYAVTPKTLSVSGLTAANKVYDGTTSASAAGTPSIGLELITGDQVTADLSAIQFAFLDKNAGIGKTVRVTGNVLSGTDAANYQTVLSATADITPKLLTVTGVGAENKVYDGTTTATKLLNGTPALSAGIVTGDAFTVDLSNLSVAFADKDAGTAKALVVSGASMSGADAGNYRVSIPNVTADISKAALTLTADNQTRVYGEVNPAFTVRLSGFVNGETLSNSGVSGSGAATSVATQASPVSSYAITPNAGNLAAQNYAFISLVDGSLAVTPRTLHVTANNVVRLAGESDPNPFGYSVGQGGLVNGDALQSVAIDAPSGSAAASGGTVFSLKPRSVVFAAGAPDNYAMHLDDGYLIVLPKPDDPATITPEAAKTALFVELNPGEQAQAQSELNSQQTALVAPPSAPAFVPFEPTRRVAQISRDLDEVRRLARQLAQAASGDSSLVLPVLRNQPVVQWNESLAPALLNPVGGNE